MSWRREMEVEAARIAFPDWELRPDDEVTVTVIGESDGGFSTWTGDTSQFSIRVAVRRSKSKYDSRFYEWEGAAQFWRRLMTAGDR